MGIDSLERWTSILVKSCKNYIIKNLIPYEYKNNQKIKLWTQRIRVVTLK
jgi:hypothetical protein